MRERWWVKERPPVHSFNMKHTLICLLSWQHTHTPSLKPCQIKEGCSFMLQTYASKHTDTQTHKTRTHATQVARLLMLLFITIITSREAASESQAGLRSLTPIIIGWVSGVYRAVTLEETQQASRHSVFIIFVLSPLDLLFLYVVYLMPFCVYFSWLFRQFVQ